MNIANKLPDHISKTIDQHLVYIIPMANGGGIMPGGVNGPYYDIETPVRNTAHWLITFALRYKQTRDERYREGANRLVNFLLHPGKHCRQKVYVHRQKKDKDWSNGIIGQAWIAEALSIAGRTLNLPDAQSRAVEAINAFTFIDSLSIWSHVDAANGKSAMDYTLNHQLWFAAAKAEADPSFHFEIDRFLYSLQKGAFKVRQNGLICHLLYSPSVKGRLLEFRYLLLEKRNMAAVLEKEIGYHLFNLYPLARLYRLRPEHPFFQSQTFKKALNYTVSKQFMQALESNKYSYPYNSPAFEMPLVLHTFQHFFKESVDVEEVIKTLLQKQKDLTFDANRKAFTENTEDSLTLTARIYEYILGLEYMNQ